MITPSEEDYIMGHAYVPEHLPEYVITISQTEPFLFRNYLCYYGKGHLVFIGYPLKEPFDTREAKEVLNTAIKKFDPEYVALIAPAILISREICRRSDSDYYYRFDPSHSHVCRKVRNMINRASRELDIEKEQELGNEHIRLISEFLSIHEIDNGTRYIFERIPQYVSSVLTSRVFSARDKGGKLIAFDVAEFSAKNYVFYMFNLISRQNYVPGASDFLLYELIKTAKEEGKSFINLGLGINTGVTFFKKKWGGIPFLRYEYCLYRPEGKRTPESMIRRLYGPINMPLLFSKSLLWS